MATLKPPITIVHSQHRSLALAERHARALARQYGADVTITARRNDRGRFSTSGRQFTFQIADGKPYADLDDWIESFETWDGDYDYEEYDSGVDTGGTG